MLFIILKNILCIYMPHQGSFQLGRSEEFQHLRLFPAVAVICWYVLVIPALEIAYTERKVKAEFPTERQTVAVGSSDAPGFIEPVTLEPVPPNSKSYVANCPYTPI